MADHAARLRDCSGPGEPLQVVLVDDSEFDIRLHSRVIRRAGTEVSLGTFTYADHALLDMRLNGPRSVDLILLDISMPRMNGFEFLAAARAAFGADLPPVVLLSTSADPGDLGHAARDPAVLAYLRKPLAPAAFDQVAARLRDDTVTIDDDLLHGVARPLSQARHE